MLAFGLTARLTSPRRVEEPGSRLAELPSELGAPDAVSRLVEAGAGLGLVDGLLALLPMTFHGEAWALSGFLPGFVLFHALPLDLGAPFGKLMSQAESSRWACGCSCCTWKC